MLLECGYGGDRLIMGRCERGDWLGYGLGDSVAPGRKRVGCGLLVLLLGNVKCVRCLGFGDEFLVFFCVLDMYKASDTRRN